MRDGMIVDTQTKPQTEAVTDSISDKPREIGLYTYRFVISADIFKQDATTPADGQWKEGVYTIVISDTDDAGHTSTNKDKPISFTLDDAKPVIENVTGLPMEPVNASEQEIRFTVSDSIGLAKITLKVNDVEVESWADFGDNNKLYEAVYKLKESKDEQKIEIVVTDIFNNVRSTMDPDFISDYQTAVENETNVYVFNSNVLITTDKFVLWKANKPLFWGSIAGGAGVLAMIALAFVLRRRRPQDELD